MVVERLVRVLQMVVVGNPAERLGVPEQDAVAPPLPLVGMEPPLKPAVGV